MATDFTATIKWLAGKDWRRQETHSEFLGKDGELIRHLLAVGDEQQQAALQFLDTYTDLANYGGTPPDHCYYVDNPRAGKKTYAGRWRLVSNKGGLIKPDGENQPPQLGIIQTLRKGYLASIITAGALDFSEARIVEPGRHNPLRGEFMVQWRNVNPETMAAVAASIPATVTDPTIMGESVPYQGKWHRKTADDHRVEDGSAVVQALFRLEDDTLTEPVAADSAENTLTKVEMRFDTRAAALSAQAALERADGTTFQTTLQPTGEGWLLSISMDTKKLLDTGWQEYISANGNQRCRVAANMTENQKDLFKASLRGYVSEGGYYYEIHNRFGCELNAAGLWHATCHEIRGPQKDLTDTWLNYTNDHDFIEESQPDKDGWGWRRTVTEWVKQTHSVSTAYDFVRAKGAIKGSHVQVGDGGRHCVAYLYKATKWDWVDLSV